MTQNFTTFSLELDPDPEIPTKIKHEDDGTFPPLVEFITRVMIENSNEAELEDESTEIRSEVSAKLSKALRDEILSDLTLSKSQEIDIPKSDEFQRSQQEFRQFVDLSTKTATIENALNLIAMENQASQEEYSSLLEEEHLLEQEIVKKLENVLSHTQNKGDDYLFSRTESHIDRDLEIEKNKNVIYSSVIQRLLISSRINWSSKDILEQLVQDD